MAHVRSVIGKTIWLVRHVVFPAIVALVVVAAIGGVLEYRDSQMRNFLSGNQPGSDNDVTASSRTSLALAPVSQASPRAVQVNSYPPGREYPLSEWQVVEDAGGFVDAVFINGELMGMDEVIQVKSGDVIHMTGWAGHRMLGMRFPEVLFSVCDKVIGGAAVTGTRSDVAESVHPNLMYSGWEADLFAADLPDCDETTISVWGRPPVGWTLRPVLGDWSFAFQASAEESSVTVIHEEPLVRPEDVKEAETYRLSIHHDSTALHQCADVRCDVVAKLSQGALNAVVVEELDGWVLLQSAKGSGWIIASSFRLLP